MKILSVVGARPNFVKLASVSRALAARSVVHRVVHTGQHYDSNLSASFFSDLEIPAPDIHLGAGAGPPAEQTARILLALAPVLEEERPDRVLVYGDVNSTLAAGLAAAQAGLPLAHVEAGLRSRDRSMPEERNRIVVDHLADLLFATTEEAADNLRAEGIAREKIRVVGNTMIDSLAWALPRTRAIETPAGDYAVATLHRASNTDDSSAVRRAWAVLSGLAEKIPTVFPVHPRTRAALEAEGLLDAGAPGLRLVPPLGYLDFLALLSRARIVLTDSGGIQDETSYLGIPCLTLRANTERPETLRATNRLLPADPDAIRAAAREILAVSREVFLSKRREEDGCAGLRIAEILAP